MKYTDDITIQSANHIQSEVELSQIYLLNKPLNLFVQGIDLKCTIQIDSNKYILFMTLDCMFEETLHIHLIDVDKLIILDSFWLGAMYETDFFPQQLLLNDNTIVFQFLSTDRWEITYIPLGYFSFNYHLFNPLIHYNRFKLIRYLKINLKAE